MARKVLVAVLNWGLGHAVRSISVVHAFLENGDEVMLGGNGISGEYLRTEFPQLPYVEFPPFEMSYSAGRSQLWAVLVSLPRILYSSWQDHRFVCRLVRDEKIDVLFSDNRFGLFCKYCHSIYMTHQLRIKMPSPLSAFEPMLKSMHGFVVSRFDDCWVPDFPGERNLSGKLSHPKSSLNVRYVGPLSRFDNRFLPKKQYKYKYLFVLSGVEPQRSIFESKVLRMFAERKDAPLSVLVRGVDVRFGHVRVVPSNLEMEGVLQKKRLSELMENADVVVCRSGYTSVMELASISHKAVLIPTPGQTEQEYLSVYLSSRYGQFSALRQDALSWNNLILSEAGLSEEPFCFDSSLLRDAVTRI